MLVENQKVSAEVREFVRSEDAKVVKQVDEFKNTFIEHSHNNQIAMLEFSQAIGGLTKAIDGMVEQTGKREKYVDGKLEEQDREIKRQNKDLFELKDSRKARNERNKNFYTLIGTLAGNTAFIGFILWILSQGKWSPF